MLTAKSDEMHRLHGFDVGADTTSKAFSPQELVRARQSGSAPLRQYATASSTEKPIVFDTIRIDPRTRSVSVGATENIALTAKNLICCGSWLGTLARCSRAPVARSGLGTRILWRREHGYRSRRRLREKVESDRPIRPLFKRCGRWLQIRGLMGSDSRGLRPAIRFAIERPC